MDRTQQVTSDTQAAAPKSRARPTRFSILRLVTAAAGSRSVRPVSDHVGSAAITVEFPRGTTVGIRDHADHRLFAAIDALVGPTGSVWLGPFDGVAPEIVCVRWRPDLSNGLAGFLELLGGLAPTIVISLPRLRRVDLAPVAGVLHEWGYELHRVARVAPFDRRRQRWIAATSDRRIGPLHQRHPTR